MRVLLIYPKSRIPDKIILPPLGLTYIATILSRTANCEVEIVDERIDDVDIISKAKKYELIGFSTHIHNIKRSLFLAHMIKKNNPDVRVVFGGPWVSCTGFLKSKDVDYIVLGEGEFSFLNLVKKLSSGEKPKIRIISSKSIENLDNIPFPDYSFYKNFSSYMSNEGVRPHVMLLTSRGCPFPCTFCTKKVFGYRVRIRNPKNIIKEVKYLVENFGVKGIDIADDNFGFNKRFAIKICELLAKEKLGVIINCTNGLRIETITKKLLKKMKQANFHKISIGIESGDIGILRHVKKRIDFEKAIKVVKWCRELGIIVQAFFMLGLPGDNKNTIKKTLDFAKRLNPHYAYFHMALPFPGTELYKEILRNGEFLFDIDNGLDKGYFSHEPLFILPGMNTGVIECYAKRCYKEFYLRPKKIFDVLFTLRNFNQFIWSIKSFVTIVNKF